MSDQADFRLGRGTVGDISALVIADEPSGTSVAIATTGATLLSWRTPAAGATRELVDGYRDRAELLAQAGVRSGIMAPFTNRIRDARYAVAGVVHDLSSGAKGEPPALLHGLVRDSRFAPVEAIATSDSFMLRLRNQSLKDAGFVGYPFAYEVDVVYVVRRSGIEMEIVSRNFGDEPIPVATGWHPYLTLGAPVDQLVLTVPAARVVVTDDALIPLGGGAAFRDIEGGDPLDYRAPRRIGSGVIDACFVDLAPDPDGRIRTSLENPAVGLALDVWQERGAMHVYTADHLTRGARGALALEPVEAITDAFNRPDQRDVVMLEPGMVRAFRFGVEVRR
ncbi:MAG: hypothetical protein BGO95_00660 [Micrococcales bacterium 73-13]|nr:MAG: hypothetical protein BGO95_00660 [Micrococcales bacterium 73-13]